jgi:kelch-like protein 2/3
MEHVRLPLLSQDFLIQRVEEEPLVKNNTVCKDYLIEAMKYHLLRPEQKLLYMTPRTKQRSPAGLPKVRFDQNSIVTCNAFYNKIIF